MPDSGAPIRFKILTKIKYKMPKVRSKMFTYSKF